MANVRFQNVNKTYPGGFHAVLDPNLEIADGEHEVRMHGALNPEP